MSPTRSALHSDLLAKSGFAHAFFTREGGVSEGPFRSLNFSTAVGDAPERVAENLRRAATHLNVRAERVYFASQVHGVDVVELDGSEDREHVLLERRADAVFSLARGLACGVRSADCVPILVADRESGAALAIHAGWRGTEAGVVSASLRALRERLGADGDLIAAIGPHISAPAFEVGPDVAARLAACSAANGVVFDDGDRPHVDLRRIVRAQLEAQGLAPTAIDDVAGCTVTEPARFFSFRRDGARSGRHLSAIVPRSEPTK